MASVESTKLQHHLALLKQEYSKLQNKYNDIESKYNTIAAGLGDGLEETFASRLLNTITNLYNSTTYSDIIIKLLDRKINAHKLVLTARSDMWNETVLADRDELDWMEMDPQIGSVIIEWIYTNKIQLNSIDLALTLIRKAFEFKLNNLVKCCEQYLIANVNIRTCVKFYTIAEETNAAGLRDYCSGIISSHWDDLNSSDFEHMSGPLLHNMLKSKTKYPLHSAVRLLREDVVFLCLVENASKLPDIVNVWSEQGELPLDLALRAQNDSIAKTLVQHNCDLNIRDNQGDTLLHRAIKHEDSFSVLFLLDNHADASLCTSDGGDSPLHLLAGANNLDKSDLIADKLLEQRVDINKQNSQGFTPLHIAIQADNKPIFDLLLEQKNILVNLKTSDEHTPLYFALLKYEAGDNADDGYASALIKKEAQTSPVYVKHNDSLVQILPEMKYEKSAVFLSDHILNVNHVNMDGESALHVACKNSCSKLNLKLLERGTNGNLLTNELRQTALHYAVKYKSLDCVESFITFNRNIQNELYTGGDLPIEVNFNVRDMNGDTPVSLAVNNGLIDLVPVLIKGKADVNVRNGKYFTLLHQAILKEDAKTAIFLLDNGADFNAVTADMETPLQLAIHCRLGEVVDVLCSRGVDMSAPDREGSCPLWAALNSRQYDIASIIVRHGADTDCWGSGPDGCKQTLLHRAIDENKEGAAMFLIQAGCDLDSPRLPGPDGEGGDEAKDKASPLHLCCQWGLETVLRTLIEHRANVNSRDVELKTPLHIAIENQHDAIISLLLTVPEIDLTMRDKSGLTPFAAALTVRNNKAAQAILDKLPSAAEQVDTKGQNFLHIAIKKGDIESALFLLTVRVDVNSRVQDSTLTPPIHLAARHGNETLVRSLILAGARVDDRDAHKRTALHVAAEAGNSTAISALLQNGAHFDAVDSENDNALHIAVREGHLSVVRVLLTESTIDAESMNLKGRNPLHELCKYGKDNSAAICDLFLECMPKYPINKPDINGNSPLLLAYMKGNANLCRTLVRFNGCLGSENNERVTIFNYQVPSKQLLNRLLDELSQPGVWTTTDLCQECGKNFTLTMRTHHCRHCGRTLCNKCSDLEVPILKFGENKPVRVCKVCFEVLKTGSS